MIGNDIVDLQLAKNQSNWKRKGYLDKIFTLIEQNFINNAINQEFKVWELWSRKEAVYKILLQKGEKPGFYPIKIECKNNEIVVFNNELFYTKTYLNTNYLYTVAVVNEVDFCKIMPFSGAKLIFKIDGIPFLNMNNKIVPVSKTHHGNFEKSIYLNI